ncbi:MAG: hypothetical protein QMD65_03755 [Patescibacteria group bacterium]|nr:hypothetical protein [Patescibacteria group bacterium]
MAIFLFSAQRGFLAISIATTISENYIALTVLLGVFINKEKLQRHQFFGIAIAIISVLVLSYINK